MSSTYSISVPPGGRPGPPMLDTPVTIDLGPAIPTVMKRLPETEHMQEDDSTIQRIADQVAARVQPRIDEAMADLERAAKAARDATVAEAGRFERRIEGYTTGQTVGFAVATFVTGALLGGLIL